MKIYYLSQDERSGYDTYDACIVCAENPEDAKTISPEGEFRESRFAAWASSPETVKAEEIGTANSDQKRGIILSSFNAG